MNTLTPEQFASKYGQESLSAFDNSSKVSLSSPEQSLTDIVGQDIADRTTRVGDILNRKDIGLVTKGVQVFGQGAGLAANTLEQTAMKVPGVKQATKAVGAGFNWLTTSDYSPVKYLGDLIGSSKILQTAVHLYDTDKNFQDSVDAVSNIIRLGGDIEGAVNSANFATNVTNKIIRNAGNVATDAATTLAETGKNVASNIAKEQPAKIMNRIARINPNDAIDFEKMSGGRTVGQYLTDTGNFGAPDKIITNEASKLIQSKSMVDTELAKLPGVYKYGAIEDALNGLLDVAEKSSTPNVKAPYLSEAQSLVSKYASGGLDMGEINNLKRLYERYVKLGYDKKLNPDKVSQATNVDTAIRNWQIQKASDLGFKNIKELNKQTQLSKFLVDKLGDKIIGQSALNNVGLTDWIVLANGSPESIAGFLTKKFFSSRAVQAKIAEMLNIGQPVNSIIMPDVNPTIENSLRRQWRQGTLPELPPGESPVKASYVPIILRGESTIEPPAQQISTQIFNPDKTLRLNAPGQNPIQLSSPSKP